jgi:hypothetical protein
MSTAVLPWATRRAWMVAQASTAVWAWNSAEGRGRVLEEEEREMILCVVGGLVWKRKETHQDKKL